jgi:hypothetical protein
MLLQDLFDVEFDFAHELEPILSNLYGYSNNYLGHVETHWGFYTSHILPFSFDQHLYTL